MAGTRTSQGQRRGRCHLPARLRSAGQRFPAQPQHQSCYPARLCRQCKAAAGGKIESTRIPWQRNHHRSEGAAAQTIDRCAQHRRYIRQQDNDQPGGIEPDRCQAGWVEPTLTPPQCFIDNPHDVPADQPRKHRSKTRGRTGIVSRGQQFMQPTVHQSTAQSMIDSPMTDGHRPCRAAGCAVTGFNQRQSAPEQAERIDHIVHDMFSISRVNPERLRLTHT